MITQFSVLTKDWRKKITFFWAYLQKLDLQKWKKNLKILGIFKRWTKIGIPRPIFEILANFVSKIMNRPLRGIVWDWVNGFYCIFNTLYHWRIRWIFSRWFKPIRNCKGPFLNFSSSFPFTRPHFSFLLSFNRYSLGVNRIGIIRNWIRMFCAWYSVLIINA